MNRDRVAFLFLNIGHFFDHLLVLIFATVAALALAAEWNMSYGALIPYATPGFIAFGLFALPAGWIADKWSREGMMVIFFLGIGLSALMTALAQTPVQIGAGLLAIGVFAAIYHPVGLAMVVHGRTKTGMPLAVNGVFGNMGVAAAALLAGVLTRQFVVRRRGEEAMDSLKPYLNGMSIIGLLFTLIVMFALKGDLILEQPMIVVDMAIPMTIFFVVMFFAALLISSRLRFPYGDAVAVAFNSTGRDFEIAIALAITAFSPTVALATVVGPLIEVPIMLALVWSAIRLRPRLFPGQPDTSTAAEAEPAQPG